MKPQAFNNSPVFSGAKTQHYDNNKILKRATIKRNVYAILLFATIFFIVFGLAAGFTNVIAEVFASVVLVVLLVSQVFSIRKLSQLSPSVNLRQVFKRSSVNADLSFVCSLFPNCYYLCYLIVYGKSIMNGTGAGIVFWVYYYTIGIPLFLIWLICGILGLKSEKRSLSIASLIIKPVSILIFILISFLVF